MSDQENPKSQRTESGNDSNKISIGKRILKSIGDFFWGILTVVGIISAIILIIGLIYEVFTAEEFWFRNSPNQWFKSGKVIQSELSDEEKDAINEFYAYAKNLDDSFLHYYAHDKNYRYKKENRKLLNDIHPLLIKKYKRRCLMDLFQEIAKVVLEEKGQSPEFIREDYFLKYDPKIEVVEWFVKDTRRTDGINPRYVLNYAIRNFTSRYIDKMDIKVTFDGNNYVNLYTLIPTKPLQTIDYQVFTCAIREDDFRYINNRTSYGSIKQVYLK